MHYGLNLTQSFPNSSQIVDVVVHALDMNGISQRWPCIGKPHKPHNGRQYTSEWKKPELTSEFCTDYGPNKADTRADALLIESRDDRETKDRVAAPS